MNWLSIALLAVIALLTWRAFVNGFIRELVSLCVAILAVPIAGVFYDDLYRKLSPIVTNETMAKLVAFLAILGGVIIGGQVVAHLLKQTVAMLNLGAADRLAGGLFGFVKAVILCQVILIALVAFPEPDLHATIDESPVATVLIDSAPMVLAFLPKTFEAQIDLFRAGMDAAQALSDGTPTPTPAR
ncbi:MAG: CvpA family protein [Dehalococcoidia bacterium]|nr:CvpA family protein [Dehalococcoidia bacterium]